MSMPAPAIERKTVAGRTTRSSAKRKSQARHPRAFRPSMSRFAESEPVVFVLTPEPATFGLLALGLSALGAQRRRRGRASRA